MFHAPLKVPLFGLPSLSLPANVTATRPGAPPAVSHGKTVECTTSRSTWTGCEKPGLFVGFAPPAKTGLSHFETFAAVSVTRYVWKFACSP